MVTTTEMVGTASSGIEESRRICTKVLRQFPKGELKEYLSHRYDEFMDLRMVKLGKGPTGAESTNEKPRYETNLTIPQKRPLDSS